MLKKLLSVLLVLSLFVVAIVPCFSVNAAIIEEGNIKIASVSGITGDDVLVPVTIENNPGIMAITISITYNSSALDYTGYMFGDVVEDYTVVAHPNKKFIRFVNCESRNRYTDGTLLTLKFKIKDKATAEFHKIDIEYSLGDFCNWTLDKIMPTITEGGVDVAYNGNNCVHKKYGEWTKAAAASCEEGGAESRLCTTCGHVELRDTKPLGHEYDEKWTVTKPATETEEGVMVRYCKRCDDYVDRMNFKLEHTDGGKIDNNINAEVPINDYTEGIFKEQFPGKELSDSKPQLENSKDDDVQSDVTDKIPLLESILPDIKTDGGEIITAEQILEKIREVIPKLDGVLKVMEIAFGVLIYIMIIL